MSVLKETDSVRRKLITSMKMTKLKPFLWWSVITCLIGLNQCTAAGLPEPEAWKNSSEEYDDDVDGYVNFIQKLIAGIVAFVIVVVAVCLILCFCCPICIIAKMRQRRGVVIRTPATVSNGQTVTVALNRSAPPSTSTVSHPPVIAIPNNYNAGSKPYPVQESVTVVPLIQPQQQPAYPMPMQYPSGQQPYPHPPQNFELPPPYPGLPREADNTNLPYNPYYAGESSAPTAPPK